MLSSFFIFPLKINPINISQCKRFLLSFVPIKFVVWFVPEFPVRLQLWASDFCTIVISREKRMSDRNVFFIIVFLKEKINSLNE